MQTDIVAVRTPQTECYQFLRPAGLTDCETSDSEHTKVVQVSRPAGRSCHLTVLQLDSSSPCRARSPRPTSLPGVTQAGAANISSKADIHKYHHHQK